jgi:hypothetical protein
MTFDHVFWTHKPARNGCVLLDLKGYKKAWRLSVGADLLAEFPSDAFFEMNPDFPDHTIATDLMRNRDALILVSERLKQLVAARGVPNLQFLEVAIIDHKGRTMSTPYFIVNPVGPIDCLDLNACKPTYDLMVKSDIVKVEAFVPDKDKCVDLPEIFRPKGFSHLLVSRALAKEIDDAGMTGNGWVTPEKLAGQQIGASLTTLIG